MPPIIKLQNGNVLLKNGKPSCSCCYQLVIKYDWGGTGMSDLDTKTSAFGETVGWSCGDSGTYVQWISSDDTSINGMERIDVKVDSAREDGLWTSSYNIQCFAGWFKPVNGSGPAKIYVTYGAITKNKSISPGSQSECASTSVATVIIYSAPKPDGSYFEIV